MAPLLTQPPPSPLRSAELHNEKLGRSVNIVNMLLKCAFEHCSELHSNDSAAGQQRTWDGVIDMLNKWTRKWGSRFPTFLVPHATRCTPHAARDTLHATRCTRHATPRPRHATPRHATPDHATPRHTTPLWLHSPTPSCCSCPHTGG